MNTLKKLGIAAILPLMLVMTGCTFVKGEFTPVDKHATTASPAPKSDPLLKGFGEVITYEDGVSVSVSKPVPYSPSAYAAGVTKGAKNVMFTIVVTNNSDTALDILGFPQANSGGQAASGITDFGDDRLNEPQAPLLPGRSIKWEEAFSVADPTDVTFSFAPNFDYKDAVFDSSK